MTHSDKRKDKLKIYRNAILNNSLLPGFSTFAKQVCHYDQMVMIDKRLSDIELKLFKLTGEIY